MRNRLKIFNRFSRVERFFFVLHIDRFYFWNLIFLAVFSFKGEKDNEWKFVAHLIDILTKSILVFDFFVIVRFFFSRTNLIFFFVLSMFRFELAGVEWVIMFLHTYIYSFIIYLRPSSPFRSGFPGIRVHTFTTIFLDGRTPPDRRVAWREIKMTSAPLPRPPPFAFNPFRELFCPVPPPSTQLTIESVSGALLINGRRPQTTRIPRWTPSSDDNDWWTPAEMVMFRVRHRTAAGLTTIIFLYTHARAKQ